MGSHEKDVWLLILENKLDDIAIAIGPKTRERMDAFAEQLFCAISASARKIATVVEDAHQRGLTKTELVTELTAKLAQQQKDKAALGLPPTPSHADEILADASLYYAAFDGKNSEKMIISKLKVRTHPLSPAFSYSPEAHTVLAAGVLEQEQAGEGAVSGGRSQVQSLKHVCCLVGPKSKANKSKTNSSAVKASPPMASICVLVLVAGFNIARSPVLFRLVCKGFLLQGSPQFFRPKRLCEDRLLGSEPHQRHQRPRGEAHKPRIELRSSICD
jgi:hypothetical protein